MKYIGLVLSVKDVIKDAAGLVVELKVTYEPLTESNKPKV